MIRQLRREFFRLFRSPVMLIGIALALLVPIVFSVGQSTSESELRVYYDSVYGNAERQLAKTFKAYGYMIFGQDADPSLVSSLDDMVLALREKQYYNAMTLPVVSLFCILVFPFLLLGQDFHTGAIGATLRLGLRRTPLARAKYLFCLVPVFFVSLLSTWIVVASYRSVPLGGLPAWLLVRGLLLHALLETAALAVPLLLTFLFKRRMAVFTLSVGCAIAHTLLYAAASKGTLPAQVPLPGVLLAAPRLWSPEADPLQILYAAAAALTLLTLCGLAVCVHFKKADLP